MFGQELVGKLVRQIEPGGSLEAEVLEALDTQIAALKLQESKEQGDVDAVKSVILEFDHLRSELQNVRQPAAASAAKKGTPAKGEPS